MRDVYGTVDRQAMRLALDDLLDPRDTYGFASTGVYVFFDPRSHAILYVGLARDLAERFAQHNGLVPMSPQGCKRAQIDDWFGTHSALGYAVFVQSSTEQASVSRQRGTPSAAFYDEESNVFWDYPDSGIEEVKLMEGLLLAAYQQEHGHLPPWNKIRGSKEGAGYATEGGYRLLELAAGAVDSLLLARKSIRELSSDPTSFHFEESLHVGRMLASASTAGLGIDSGLIWRSFVDAADHTVFGDTMLRETLARMRQAGYPNHAPPPPASADTPGRSTIPVEP